MCVYKMPRVSKLKHKATMSSYLLVLVAILGFAYAEGDYSLCQQREKLDDDMREMFTELHNGYRAAFARNYKTSKMRTMVSRH
ncbi:hypothetical protein ANCCAN_03260 [Ancylostoma caninum]|nr:hypothetical protein ANCCAN_03260 [Ancylostoma caninum]